MKPDFRKQQHDFNAVWSQTNALYCRWAEHFGLNYITLMTLYGLDIYGSMTQKNLCDFYGFPKQTVFSVLGEEKIIQMFETISAFNALMEKKLEAEE